MNIVSHPSVETPNGNIVVWRYMSLAKFLDMIVHNRLFFVNAIKLTDAREMSIPLSTLTEKRVELELTGLKGRDLEEEIAVFEWQHNAMRDLTLVNCWSIGRYESYALWKIYVGGAQVGVAVRSSISRLKKAIINGKDPVSEDVYIGRVKYANQIPVKELSRFTLITTKKLPYEFENELRLFILHFPLSESETIPPYDSTIGRGVAVDLAVMIDKIYLSPFVGRWFRATLDNVIKKIQPVLLNRLVTSSIRDV
ncbi:MAG TPA: hypothetical protein VN285_08080 [Candidatus Deferrimicrobium sp.]|nr:hypothetical protein [Candidatus Deferrimicrobium sp.]